GVEHGVKRLDQILFDDFAALRHAREAEDARILAFIEGCDATRLASTLQFKTMDGTPSSLPVGPLLGHVFNHQTHHRGQVHAMLTQTNVPAPPLDLLYYLREAR